MSDRKFFVLSHEAPCIKQINVMNLKPGDVYYMEEEEGDIVVDMIDGFCSFIGVVLEKPYELIEYEDTIPGNGPVRKIKQKNYVIKTKCILEDF